MPLGYTDNAPSEVAAQVLIDLGIGTDPDDELDWATRATGEADRPDNHITVYDTTPFMDGRTQDGVLQGMFGLQIRVRSSSPRNGWKKIIFTQTQLALVRDRIAHRAFDSVDHRYMVHSFNGFGGVLVLGKESPTSKRNLFTINCYINFKQY